ncbi:MAG: uracil-DNA glycosylase [Massilibacteroides sp.]|nr:uracil-DNA glycosylase [Massilibacteroides sp.]MDD3061606.1 uracil-DNA glycosylase [Massilibacteroides sp.]MDD4660010.1 uracil-DNA glycosylase [Massilibacteroides sp.]
MMDQTMNQLREEIEHCKKCDLWKSRNHVIFGEGNSCADIFIIGEAPGRDEDRIGRPFIGPSGILLDKILAACAFNREEHVFISNIVRCRPPGNRLPTSQEAAVCIPWLYKQLELMDPKIVILLGATALRYMIGPDYRITQVRGRWIEQDNRLFMPVYHPSALLRNPQLKRDTWGDFKKVVYKYRELVNPSHFSPYIT